MSDSHRATHAKPRNRRQRERTGGHVRRHAAPAAGGAALDAVELAARITEDDPDDHTVGYGGLPNVLGDVELDASIMDGRTLQSGAVAALRGYGNPVVIARQVMERLPHVMLAGEGAAQFAARSAARPATSTRPSPWPAGASDSRTMAWTRMRPQTRSKRPRR